MQIIQVRNPRKVQTQHAIVLEVLFEGENEVCEFVAVEDDVEEHGRQLYQRAVAGDFGSITNWKPPEPDVPIKAEGEL